VTFEDLENLYRQFRVLQKNYYQMRYKYWRGISLLKKSAKRNDGLSWKEFERRCRNLTHRMKRQMGKRPRGMHLDHKVSVFKAYIMGWTVEETCDLKNLEYLSRKDNQWKGILSTVD
jgi:hypothetical protein